MIMFLTDGGTEKPEELFKKYNANKTVCFLCFERDIGFISCGS